MAKSQATNGATQTTGAAQLPAQPDGPRGQKMLNLSPGRLNKGAGKFTAADGEPRYCGRIFGEAYHYEKEESTVYPGTFNYVFHGRFGFIDAAGNQGRGPMAYLPSMVQKAIRAPLDKGEQAVPFAFEIWTAPDARESRAGFFYDAYDCMPNVGAGIDAIAIAAGFIDAPLPQLTHQQQRQLPAHDPHTGEIAEDDAEMRLKDGLEGMIGSSRKAGQPAPEPGSNQNGLESRS
jgi:hypothetical protein